eukprot:scaffold149368_cov62-Attheya_sp.AAC.1
MREQIGPQMLDCHGPSFHIVPSFRLVKRRIVDFRFFPSGTTFGGKSCGKPKKQEVNYVRSYEFGRIRPYLYRGIAVYTSSSRS